MASTARFNTWHIYKSPCNITSSPSRLSTLVHSAQRHNITTLHMHDLPQ